METKIIQLRICLLIIFCSLSWFAVAQTKNDDIKLLQGEWVWEEASTVDNEQQVTFDFYNDYYKFYAEIEVGENIIFLKNREEKTLEIKYEVEGNFLGFDFPSGESYIAEWVILENKLYMEFTSFDVSKKGNLLVVYKRK